MCLKKSKYKKAEKKAESGNEGGKKRKAEFPAYASKAVKKEFLVK